jgi:exodeoxyribonuclease VII small subunit
LKNKITAKEKKLSKVNIKIAGLEKKVAEKKAIEELEDIIKSLEQGDVPLDDTIELYERGAKLKDFCEKKLKDAEIKIKKINENTKTKE